VEGLRDKGSGLGRIGKLLGSLRRVEVFSLAKEGSKEKALREALSRRYFGSWERGLC
jgi:hypothetical protein